MNTEIQTFNFNDSTLRTLTDENGDPWFVLKDCMSILNLGNPTETVKMFDDDEFRTTEVTDSIGRRQQTYIISESGFYRLVMKSRKPEAKGFKRWITHEVLPSIRKHGTKADGTKFAFPPTVRITRKGLALIHKRLGETRLNETLENTTH